MTYLNNISKSYVFKLQQQCTYRGFITLNGWVGEKAYFGNNSHMPHQSSLNAVFCRKSDNDNILGCAGRN